MDNDKAKSRRLAQNQVEENEVRGDMEHEAWEEVREEERPIYLPLECVASLFSWP